jgi:hypothetical protein
MTAGHCQFFRCFEKESTRPGRIRNTSTSGPAKEVANRIERRQLFDEFADLLAAAANELKTVRVYSAKHELNEQATSERIAWLKKELWK